jgi:SNF2 family DNA or RNA helicase
MVATPSAGGKGRTWSIADLVIYYSSTYDLEHRDQSEQRVQGFDKTRQVDYIDLVAPKTVDTKILQALRKKINMAATITGDQWKEWII